MSATMQDRPSVEQKPTKLASHSEADRKLGDTPYLVYCLVKAAQHFITLAGKRWPETL